MGMRRAPGDLLTPASPRPSAMRASLMRGPWPAVVALVTLVTVILLYAARGNMPALLPSAAGSPARLSLKDRQIVEQQCSKEGTKPNSKRILLTGAAGFVGFHSSQAFKGRGDVVVGIDNFNDYYPVSLKRARRGVLREKAGIHIVEADINDMEVLTALFDICNFTHVVDLAAQAGVRYAMRNPMSYVDSNLKGTVSILEVVKNRKPLPIFVYASSSSVYGLNSKLPFSETDAVERPASLYAATKRSMELMAHVYFHLYGISMTGLRFFTVYGPWGRPDMSYMAFTRNILDGKPIRVFQGPGGSELGRDFTYIDDIVAGILGSVDSAPPSGKATAALRVFNLGNTHPLTVSDLITTLESNLGKKAIVNKVPVAAGDVLYTHANVTAAKAAFGYEPKTHLSDGIKKFVTWYTAYYGPDGKRRPADEIGYVPD